MDASDGVHAVCLGDETDVVGGGDGAGDGGLLLVVGEALACKVGGAALGDLDDDGALDVAGGGVSVRAAIGGM